MVTKLMKPTAYQAEKQITSRVLRRFPNNWGTQSAVGKKRPAN